MPNDIRRSVFRAAMPLFLAAALSTAATAQDAASRPLRPRTTAEDLQMFSQVLNQIRVNHPDSLDMHDLFMAAIEGMIHAADPHSFVIPAIRLNPAKSAAYRDGKLYPVPIIFRSSSASIRDRRPPSKTFSSATSSSRLMAGPWMPNRPSS